MTRSTSSRRRGKRGGKQKKIQNDLSVADKKIGKKPRFSKKKADGASGSEIPAPIPANGDVDKKEKQERGKHEEKGKREEMGKHEEKGKMGKHEEKGKREEKGKHEEKGDGDRLSGFIFMCSGKTKPECYQHRIFGLPAGKMDVVQKIKPGTKLFLYDFDLKLLYGVYKATSAGEHGLEKAAFGGRFPAQVKFKIFRDCIPIPERELRKAIPENYQNGSKFTPELKNKQVKKLMEIFKPVTLPPRASGAPPEAHASLVDDGLRQHAMLPPPENTYARSLYLARGPPLREPQYVQPVSAQAHSDVYHPETRLPYLAEKPVLVSQDPYSRYRAVPETLQRDRLYSRENEYHRSYVTQSEDYYNPHPARISSYAPPPSYAPPSSHTHAELPSYYASASYEDPNRVYADSLPRSATGRLGATGGHVPVSSLYSFAGPTPAYR